MLGAERFSEALIRSIDDPSLRALPLTGAIDQFVDSTDALADRTRSRALAAALYPAAPQRSGPAISTKPAHFARTG